MTLYVSRLLAVPPLTASAAFDVAARLPVATGTARLEPTGPVVVDRRWSLSPYRVMPAVLRHPGRWRPLPVEVEVAVWSDVAVELAIRPVRRTVRAVDAYAAAATAVLAALDARIGHTVSVDVEEAVDEVFLHPAFSARLAPPRP